MENEINGNYATAKRHGEKEIKYALFSMFFVFLFTLLFCFVPIRTQLFEFIKSNISMEWIKSHRSIIKETEKWIPAIIFLTLAISLIFRKKKIYSYYSLEEKFYIRYSLPFLILLISTIISAVIDSNSKLPEKYFDFALAIPFCLFLIYWLITYQIQLRRGSIVKLVYGLIPETTCFSVLFISNIVAYKMKLLGIDGLSMLAWVFFPAAASASIINKDFWGNKLVDIKNNKEQEPVEVYFKEERN